VTFAATMAGYTTGLIGWWRLNEPSGTSIADSSGAGHTMTAAAGVTVAQPGLLGDGTGDTACTFNGTAQCSIAHATWMNTSAVTVFCRFNGTVAAQSTLVCIDDSGSSPGFSWRLQRGVSSLQGLHRSALTDADMMTLHLAASYASLFGPRTPLYNPSRNRATLRASSF
jgi:hypothetical protein